MVGGKEEGVPLMDHVEASISPEVPATRQYSIEYSLFRDGKGT
jgi:hypothetical protein